MAASLHGIPCDILDGVLPRLVGDIDRWRRKGGIGYFSRIQGLRTQNAVLQLIKFTAQPESFIDQIMNTIGQVGFVEVSAGDSHANIEVVDIPMQGVRRQRVTHNGLSQFEIIAAVQVARPL